MMMPATDMSREDIEAAVARGRAARAEAIRAGAISLNLILKHFLSDRRQATAAPANA